MHPRICFVVQQLCFAIEWIGLALKSFLPYVGQDSEYMPQVQIIIRHVVGEAGDIFDEEGWVKQLATTRFK